MPEGDESAPTPHKPWDEPWSGVGVPECGFWTEERVQQADELVADFLESDFDAVERDGLAAGVHVQKRPLAENVPLVSISNEFYEVPPIKYDNRHLTAMSTESAVRRARGDAHE